ncbi:hypothetical protein [Candidatus Manganitrophus noduliformans]|uniref:Uncharacterized protein n=1 Tax=Candidatus Manganitrophus noduliformans TaxID=2606439 RepID=A0A7X6DMM4_9BACT|nr:hypothetical protein [Candidatus Manganitrophus noduliformans]NKE69874.1 hypothetical protein [Candidatus Manganitrophus noduliformans]
MPKVCEKVVGAELKPITGMSEIEAWRWLEKRPAGLEYVFENDKFKCVGLHLGHSSFFADSVLSVVLVARAELRKRGLPDE